MLRDVELLAPAGSFEILKGVINAGANAVYLGGSKFGARAYANNFSDTEIIEALDYAHLHHAKIYLTVNTLLKNTEINKELYDYLLPLYRAGLDAVLVQDMGVLRFIRTNFPNLPIHASTQMTVTSKESALYLKALGVSRVVVSRELSLKEMKEIYDASGLELEAFVHGALCYSYSGMCLFSSMLGGRSGNRGRCAQPCRLAYSVCDDQKTIKKDSYILSLKDLCGIEDLEELKAAGICSLKIEGRMKQLPYACGVTALYRKALDGIPFDKDLLLKLGNRGGFTDSYYKTNNSASMITYEDSSLHSEELELQAPKEQKIKIKGSAVLKIGQPAQMTVSLSDSYSFTAYGNPVDPAQSRPLLAADVSERLQKTGDSEFVFTDFSLEEDDNIFIPNGALNALRRDALAGLKSLLLNRYKRKEETPYRILPEHPMPPSGGKREEAYIASISFREQLNPLLDHEEIAILYLDLCMYDREFNHLKEDLSLCRTKGKQVYLSMPVILRSKDISSFEGLADLLNSLPFEGFSVNSLDSLALCKRLFPDKKTVGDYGLYTFNDIAVDYYLSNGLERICAPLELNRGELAHRNNASSEIIVYGRYPLMQTANCVCKNTKGCKKTTGLLSLKDRKNVEFPIINHCNYCYNTVYNSVATNLLPVREELKQMGFSYFRFHFTCEGPEEIHTILRCIDGENHYNQSNKFTYGHYKRGVE